MTQLGKYDLHESLGSGAFADVYRATDGTLKRTVALKVLKPALLVDQEAFSRFVQEAQVAGGLFHPHIATVLDLGEMEGRHFIAMRYVDGPSLDKVIAERAPLPWEEALRIITQVADALAYAHGRGLVHRDVKPQNILVSPVEGAVLTDFGLVRALEASGMGTRTGAILGTPQYIPPEVWNGQPATPASDQYALACVLAEMLNGQPLFSGQTPAEMVTRHVIDGPQLPTQWSAGTPDGLEAVLNKALARQPADRYAVVGEFLQALRELELPAGEDSPVVRLPQMPQPAAGFPPAATDRVSTSPSDLTRYNQLGALVTAGAGLTLSGLFALAWAAVSTAANKILALPMGFLGFLVTLAMTILVARRVRLRQRIPWLAILAFVLGMIVTLLVGTMIGVVIVVLISGPESLDSGSYPFVSIVAFIFSWLVCGVFTYFAIRELWKRAR